MGNFYVNYTIKGATQAAVAAALTGRTAAVTPAVDGAVVVFDVESDGQDEDVILEVGAKLSADLNCPVLAVLNHDDGILRYQLHVAGELADEYNSSPDYFGDADESAGPTGGNAAELCATFGGAADEVAAILRKPSPGDDDFDANDGYVFAVERHADLIEALGLPSLAVGFGYRAVGELDAAMDDLPAGRPAGQVIRIG